MASRKINYETLTNETSTPANVLHNMGDVVSNLEFKQRVLVNANDFFQVRARRSVFLRKIGADPLKQLFTIINQAGRRTGVVLIHTASRIMRHLKHFIAKRMELFTLFLHGLIYKRSNITLKIAYCCGQIA
eukprot:scpid34016/ scgid10915/ 